MEDRYLFKAKRVDNGEWEVGSLIALPTGEYEISNKCNNPPDCDPMWYKVVITHKVNPSTICQCTGLKDKNGKMIFENDIVCGKMHGNCGYRKLVGVVQHYIDSFKVNVEPNFFSGVYKNISDTCEVIGNIFDNKELLGRNDE